MIPLKARAKASLETHPVLLSYRPSSNLPISRDLGVYLNKMDYMACGVENSWGHQIPNMVLQFLRELGDHWDCGDAREGNFSGPC